MTADGIHILDVTWADGRVERIPCTCPWCDAWRSIGPDVIRRLSLTEPEVRPDWLGPKRTQES